MGFAYSSKTGLTVFEYLVDLSVVTVAIPYFFSACAQLAYLVSRRRRVVGAMLVRDLLIATCSVLFSLWVTFAAGYQAVYQALLLLLVGIPIYAFLKARKERLGQVPEPDESLTDVVGRDGTVVPIARLTSRVHHIEPKQVLLREQGAVMATKKALVRQPSPRLADGIVTNIERQPVDVHLAAKQWTGYAEAMEEAGWEIVEVPPADDCPDGVFIEDAVVVFRNVAVITNPGADSRKPEVVGAEAAVEELGCSINRIHSPGTLDGGDVLKIGDTIYVGSGGRTNADGLRQLRSILGAARGHDHRRARARPQGAAPEVSGDRPARRNHHRLPAARRRPRVLPPLRAGAGGFGSPRRRPRREQDPDGRRLSPQRRALRRPRL